MATWPANGSNVDVWDAALLAWLTETVFNNDGTFKASSIPTFAGVTLTGDLTVAGNQPARSIVHGGVGSLAVGNNGLGQSRPPIYGITQSDAIAGTRNSDTEFGRTTGTWTVDVLIAQYAFFYAAAAPSVGNWLPIVDNDGTTITVDGVILAGADTCKTCMWKPISASYAHGQGASAFADGVFDGQNIWLVPYDSPNLVKVNPADGSMTSYAHGQGTSAFYGGVFDGQNIWLVPRGSANLVKVNPADGSMTSYAHGQAANAFIGGVFDGQNIWLVPYSSPNLVKVNPADGSMTSYAHGQGPAAFIGGVFDGQNIWLVPRSSANLVKVNPADGSMTSYAHGQGPAAFIGGVFDGQNIWLVPLNGSNLVKICPIGFGTGLKSTVRAEASFSLSGTDVITASLASLPDTYPQTDNTHYLGKNDDDTPFAWKGLILKDQAGTGKYYRLEVVDNALQITDLTD